MTCGAARIDARPSPPNVRSTARTSSPVRLMSCMPGMNEGTTLFGPRTRAFGGSAPMVFKGSKVLLRDLMNSRCRTAGRR
jgi:hypothetical protein